ncbi:MAG: MBL fold metallo-hydrolase [Desulfuromonas sp.]|nr:MAG: MBL fold metallo-hydrolase [Desulfuromonas sp.]
MSRRFLICALFLLVALILGGEAFAAYKMEKIEDGVWAALAQPGGKATSNAIYVEGKHIGLAGGSHFDAASLDELLAAIKTVSSKPLRFIVLAHHHRGFSHIDFDFPPGVEVILSEPTLESLKSEVRRVDFPHILYSDALQLDLGGMNVVLSNTLRGHAEGDTLIALPEAETIFTGDLVYVDSVGYLGDGSMRDWIIALSFIEELGPKRIIPGYGPVSPLSAVDDFRSYLRAFFTEILAHIERGESLAQTKKSFNLPAYQQLPGYDLFMPKNIERAYNDLKATLAE